jgi:deazaflavin-dependent oxidoreductase (nitroreductase family)
MCEMPLTGEYQPGTSSWSRKHVEEYEATNGQKAGELRGRPVVVLTTVGAKTGKLRKTALMRVEHEGVYAVVASLGGSPRNPAWYYNLGADPHVELQDGAVKRDYVAHEATGDEKALWWERAVETWPDYAGYQRRTKRQIPVFVLQPMA